MSKVNIVFEDDEEGLVAMKVEFDPPVNNASDIKTGAQMMAMEFLDMLAERKEKRRG